MSTRKELIERCKEKNIKGYSTKNKDELMKLLAICTIQEVTKPHRIKPFLKWVGGKTQILEEVLSQFPKEIHHYHEPFLGGGSVLLGLLSYIKDNKIKQTGNIYASDINSNIITLYQHVQSNPDGLLKELAQFMEEYNNCTGSIINRKPTKEEATSKESYYYWIRSQFNTLEKGTLVSSAMLLFMNKMCFRGVYREGPHGFNVPYGNYKNPSIEENNIREVSTLIKDVIFSVRPFTELKVEEGDFVYLDPPYAPETETSFVGYNADGFHLDDHNKLFDMCKKLNCKWLLSNADVPLVKDTLSKYEIKIIEARRAIHSKNPESKTNEVLIRNFQ